MFEDWAFLVVHFMMAKSVYIYTYGCQMNVHDSEKMRGLLLQDGFEMAGGPEDADLIIFNTCAIREKAEQKFYSQLGRSKKLKRRRPGVRIAVAGCIAQESRQAILRRAPFVDYVLGPRNVRKIRDVAAESTERFFLEEDEGLAGQEFAPQRDSDIKAWISIMYGCNNFCSYCIVPFTRGREVSRPVSSIVAEVQDLKKKGYREVTLLGQNVNSYRGEVDFPGLLRLLDATGMERIRFVTSHPRDLSHGLVSAMAESRHVCEHIHLPLQSGSDRVLGLMNRGYGREDYLRKLGTLREEIPGIAVTSDIIVGFPGETDEEFLETLGAVSEAEFDGIFAFKYSPRPGTRAAGMNGQLPEEVKGGRLAMLLRLQEEITLRKNRALVGSEVEIMVEGPNETDAGLLCGRSRSNKIVNFVPAGETAGSIVRIRIEKAMMHSLFGSRAATGSG